MPRFMAVHSLGPGVVDRAMVEASAASTKNERAITTYRTFVNMTDGRALCVIDAPSREWLAEYFERIGLPYDFLSAVEIEIVAGAVHTPEEHALHTKSLSD